MKEVKNPSESLQEFISINANVFEKELYALINKHIKTGLSKIDLVNKMKYVTKSCEMS